MPYLQVYNDNNVLQIDDSYRNLYLSRKIQVTNNEGDISFQNGEIIAAIGNGTNTLDGYCSNNITGCHYKVNQMSPTPFLYIFTTRPVSPAKDGMQVFNENGELIFDSNHKQAKVILVGTNSGSINNQSVAIAVGGRTIESSLNVVKFDETIHSTERKNVCEMKQVPETYIEYYTDYEKRKEEYTVKEPKTVTKNEYQCRSENVPGRYEYKCGNKLVNGQYQYVCEHVWVPSTIKQNCGYFPVTKTEWVDVKKTREITVPVQKTRQATRMVLKNVCENKWVPVVRTDIIVQTNEISASKMPVLVNGSVSTKIFDTKQKNNTGRLWGTTQIASSPFSEILSRPNGVYPGYNKSSGDVFAFSYVILDVSGL